MPLYLRIPAWAENATVKVNDEPMAACETGTFHRIARDWNDGDRVTLPMLPIDLHHEIERVETAPAGPAANDRPEIALDGLIGRPLAEIERLVIEETIARHGGSVPKAARALDIAPSTIYRKIEGWARKDGASG